MNAANARILIIDGNVAAMRARQVASLGYDSGHGYAQVLRRMQPALRLDIVTPADGEVRFAPGVGLSDYDGVTITGSALNVYQGGEPVRRQVELARAVFAVGVPFFGSCWGLQVAATAAGGEVRANPRGREFGFARRVQLSDAGRAHPMFAGKPAVFEAPTVHRDEVVALPPNASVLAVNDYGVQAAAFSHARGTFWGVQYHPEFDYADMASVAERYGQTLVQDGLFRDAQGLAEFVAELRTLQSDPGNAPLLWKHGLGPAMRSEALRLLELRNWLDRVVHARIYPSAASTSPARLSGLSDGA